MGKLEDAVATWLAALNPTRQISSREITSRVIAIAIIGLAALISQLAGWTWAAEYLMLLMFLFAGLSLFRIYMTGRKRQP